MIRLCSLEQEVGTSVAVHRIMSRLYYIDATLTRRTNKLHLDVQAVAGPLLNSRERIHVKNAVNHKNAEVTRQLDNNPNTSLKFEIDGVTKVRDALAIIQDIIQDANRRFHGDAIELYCDPEESKLTTVMG